jgi:hypothetical protein
MKVPPWVYPKSAWVRRSGGWRVRWLGGVCGVGLSSFGGWDLGGSGSFTPPMRGEAAHEWEPKGVGYSDCFALLLYPHRYEYPGQSFSSPVCSPTNGSWKTGVQRLFHGPRFPHPSVDAELARPHHEDCSNCDQVGHDQFDVWVREICGMVHEEERRQ